MTVTEFTPGTLTPQDAAALSRFLGLAHTPRPDQFYLAAEAAGFNAAEIWHRAAKTTDISVMIAAAALRGKTTTLPPDPRLNPKPYPVTTATPLDTPTPKPGPTTSQPRRATPTPSQPRAGRTPWSNPATKLASVVPNPRKPGTATHVRYQNYAVGRTVKELLELGCTTGDFGWDVRHGYITFEHPAE